MADRKMSKNSGDSVIDLLDDNILLQILERLEDRFDRQAWCLSCKHFLRLEASTRNRIQLMRHEVLEGILHRYSRLEHLDLSHCIQLVDENLALVGQIAGNRLASINLSRVGGFTSAGLGLLARSCCASLTDVDLSYCSNLKDSDVLALAQISNLQALRLTGCHSITDIGLGCLAAGCKMLKLLTLKGCLGITDIGIALVAVNCKQLRTLDLSYTEVTDEGLASIATLHSLEVLNLVSCNNVDDGGLRSLKRSCRSLLKLDVSRCSNVSDAGLAALATSHLSLEQLTLSYCSIITDDLLATFQKFDHLQSIVLDGCEIARNGLPFIARGCKQLKELSLSKCRGVTDRGIAAVAQGCTALHKLNLTCCRELTDASLCRISKDCKGLESLKMESCSLITEDGLCGLGEGCPRLEELDFTECNMSDTGLKYISKCTALRSLKLGFCSTITDKGVAHIGARCCNLRELDFYRSKGIGDAGVAAIASGCPKLKLLDLSYCSKITDCSLQSLSQLRELQRLELRGCVLVSSTGLAVMASGCKRLTEIDIKRCSQIGNAGVSALSFFCPGLRMMNISYCPISKAGLLSLPRLSCLQSVRLVHLKNVTVDCFVTVLQNCKSLKNVKLPSYLRTLLPPGIAEEMESRGCRIRWMDKALEEDDALEPH
ncbi:hypothetical protein SELMODRAFT_437235 [Selaginella moellendorffii]|uniref:F-box/LRR-repeat protein 15-like leucin rich repeat domain-containing protein n=1 Tax=Selaginella moellendorffii TaxID=88036 RepID=D8QPI6_SELML|nr:F-box/LRR-repeat protein 3 [Selaginella moellendorffii]EFJ37627.1 hypothetical protein SELMODRAFT_437235 [Selaginella moellendorffii]|eukprot:XP_002960088.1 F-box/LRR-repeat protein 3 [Selaginella moellendorffii]